MVLVSQEFRTDRQTANDILLILFDTLPELEIE